MSVLLGYDEVFHHHDPGRSHPERPERLDAVLEGIALAGVAEDTVPFSPRPATTAELERVHTAAHLASIKALSGAGGGSIDQDTVVSAGSYEAALFAAGAGLDAVERLRRGEASAAFCIVRPPGHHATANRASGFCLFNNLAVAAAALLEVGERVLVLDWDAHHGSGTQDLFYNESELLFVSLHQFPFYPGSGSVEENGLGLGRGTTINIPLPAGTAGDAYRLAFDEVVLPAAEAFSPTWVLVSCGFDAHRDDPLTDLGLSAGDFADLTRRVVQLGHPGRRVLFLEGGYDLEALALSAGATVAALVGSDFRPERQTSGFLGDSNTAGSPRAVIERARELAERRA